MKYYIIIILVNILAKTMVDKFLVNKIENSKKERIWIEGESRYKNIIKAYEPLIILNKFSKMLKCYLLK